MIPQRLAALRREMKKHNIAVYVVPTSDFTNLNTLENILWQERISPGLPGQPVRR